MPAFPTSRTEKRRVAFLKFLREGASVWDACRAIGISRDTMYQWRAEDASLAKQWEEAIEQITDAAESKLYRLAMAGHFEALKLWLRSHRPEVYARKDKDYTPVTIPGTAIAGEQIVGPIGSASSDPRMVNNVMFMLPASDRDKPEVIDLEYTEEPTKAA